MPRLLCGPGIRARDVLGRLSGERPFERPWMAKYIDLAMTIDASATRQRLGWSPRERLLILNRMPFLVENRKSDILEWNRRNRAAFKAVRIEDNLRVHWMLQKHETEILDAYHAAHTGSESGGRFPTYQERFPPADLEWNRRLLMHELMSAVRTGDKSILTSYCADLAVRRYHEGFPAGEVCAALELLNVVCLRVLRRDRETDGMQSLLRDHITKTLRYGCDRAQETFELLEESRVRRERVRGGSPPVVS
jgi:hypothetical protein